MRLLTFRYTVPLLVSLSLIVGLGACADPKADGASTASSTPPVTVNVPADELTSKVGEAAVGVSVVDNSFEPRYMEVTAGTKVTFSNDGRNTHSIVAVPDGAFAGVAQDAFKPGSLHIVTFDTPGDYLYFCSIHGTAKNGQNGVIRVVAEK